MDGRKRITDEGWTLPPGLPLLVVLLYVCGCGSEPKSANPGSEPTPARHLLLVSLDALGAKHVGAYGEVRDTTPHLDALAREGVLFEEAWVQQVWTPTSHLSLLTGVYPQTHGASHERAAHPRVPTLAEILAAKGFDTAAYTGIGGYMRPESGLGRGFDTFVIGTGDARVDTPGRLGWLAEQATRSAADPEHRFFLFAHAYDVHSDVGTEVPYASPPAYRAHFANAQRGWERRGDTALLDELGRSGGPSARDVEAVHELYDAGVRFTDAEALAPLLDALDRLGLAEDTLVVVTADHGDEIFEHGRGGHQQPYRETARVPLVMRGPGLPAGRRVEELVELVDLAPTLLAQLGIEAPEIMQGEDLSPLLTRPEGATPQRGSAFVDGIMGGVDSVFWRYPASVVADFDDGRWAYVAKVRETPGPDGLAFRVRGPEELYHLGDDPEQERNRIDEEPQRAALLRSRLLAWYADNYRLHRRLGAVETTPIEFSQEEERQLEALGYGH